MRLRIRFGDEDLAHRYVEGITILFNQLYTPPFPDQFLSFSQYRIFIRQEAFKMITFSRL